MSLRDRVDPDLGEALDVMRASAAEAGDVDLAARRRAFEDLGAMLGADGPGPEAVSREDRNVPGPAGAPDVAVRIYRPVGVTGNLPGLLFIHGGGMIVGSLDTEDHVAARLAIDVGAVVVSVGYRLAPEHPDPAPVEDCYAALVWMAAEAGALGLDATRLGLLGGSAGGGLSAGVALLARDRGGPTLLLQMLIYPMLDDRNVTASSHAVVDLGVWDRHMNIAAWACLLGDRAGTEDVSPYAAATRAADLAGLPPAYIDVGDLDLFVDESVAYASRLMAAGVPVELHVLPGAYHAFELFVPAAPVSRTTLALRRAALRRVLGTS